MIEQIADKQVQLKPAAGKRKPDNPFPGLRPFLFEESHLFYGQDILCDKVIEKLLANKFVCLLGGAGVGKSSLLNCGIRSLLLSGLADGQDIVWHLFHSTPGQNPLRNLAHNLFLAFRENVPSGNSEMEEQICGSIIRHDSQGLIDLISQFRPAENQKFLFIVDQFEELFRLPYASSETLFYEEALQYVNLFLETLHSLRFNIYVIISIRSDFTDDCVMFPALAEYINKSNVIVPKISRQQLQEAVLGPLRVLGSKIEDSALLQIVNDAASSDDPLPRLQHAMRRTWESWVSLDNPDRPLSIKEYEAGGGIRNSISNHANAIYDSLTEEERKVCETMFRALTERGSENKGLTSPCSVRELAEIAKADAAAIIKIAEAFSVDGTSFLIHSGGTIREDTVLNLSHVSIMRAWNRLQAWVEEEALSSQMYRQLSQASAFYQIGKTGLLKPPDLQLALNWKEKQQPTLQWAKRYNPAFERTMVYLRTSVESYEAEEALKRKKVKQAIRRVRSLSVVLGGTALFAVALTIYSHILKQNAENQKKIALAQKSEADVKSLQAEKLSIEAFEEKKKAELAANEAEQLKQRAMEQTKALAVQKSIAETTAVQAIRKSVETEQTLNQVAKQKEQIEQTAIQANILKTEAEKEKDAAFRKRMISTAQSLAVKSFQMDDNKNLKAALAMHAYEFNNTYGGPEYNPDIYNALSSALIDLNQNLHIPLKGHSGSVRAMVVSPGNILYSTGGDGKVLAWNLGENIPVARVITNSLSGNLCMAISPNGRWLAVGSDNGTISLLDLADLNEPQVILKGHLGMIFSLVFSRDGQQLYSSGSDKNLFLWNLSDHSYHKVFDEPVSIRCLSLSPDGRFLAGGCEDGRLLLWEIRSNQLSVLTSDEQIPVYSVAFNNTGTLLATGDMRGGVRLWNPYSHKSILKFRGQSARVVDIAFSPGSDLMATASYDGTSYIFDTRNVNNPPAIIREPYTWMLAVSFSNDGKKLLIATNKPDYLYSYPFQNKVMADQLCSKIVRGLTQEEWNNYIGSDIKYKKPCE